MSHTVIHGVKHGAIHGPKHGGASLYGTGDGPSARILTPASGSEFTALGLTSPNYLHLCQELSGNLADSIGAVPLVVASTPSFRLSLSGWKRKFVGITTTTLQKFSAAIATGPNPGTQSVTWLTFLALTITPGGNRSVIVLSNGATGIKVEHTGLNKLILTVNGVAITGTVVYGTGVIPCLITFDRTAGTVALCTDQERLVGTYSAGVLDGEKGFGAVVGNGDAGARYGWNAIWTGANAEAFSTVSASRSLLQTLGWSVLW